MYLNYLNLEKCLNLATPENLSSPSVFELAEKQELVVLFLLISRPLNRFVNKNGCTLLIL